MSNDTPWYLDLTPRAYTAGEWLEKEERLFRRRVSELFDVICIVAPDGYNLIGLSGVCISKILSACHLATIPKV